MGGFFERNVQHAYANFFRRFERRQASRRDVERYLHTYAVAFVILQRPRQELDSATDLLVPMPTVAGRNVYRSARPVSRILEGGGEIEAGTNRIRVQHTDPNKDAVLSYHFHPTLRCEPGCRLQRQPAPFDEVGLIRVPAPHPRHFQIVNRY